MFNQGNGYSLADIAAVTNGGYGNNNGGWGGGFGDGSWWIIVLFLFCMMGWGNNGWGNNGGNNGGGYYGPSVLPYMYNTATQTDIQRGFDQSAIISSLNGITSGINNGFANAEISRCNAQTNILQTLANNQAATTSSMNSLAMGLQNCCCENRAATADLKYTIATENCADRAVLSDGVRDIIESQNAGVQRILDTMCQDKIDAKNERIADLERQLSMADLRASQVAQNAFITNGLTNEVDALYNRLKNCPVPSMPVYGMQPIFTCQPNNGCGCGCGANF